MGSAPFTSCLSSWLRAGWPSFSSCSVLGEEGGEVSHFMVALSSRFSSQDTVTEQTVEPSGGRESDRAC